MNQERSAVHSKREVPMGRPSRVARVICSVFFILSNVSINLASFEISSWSFGKEHARLPRQDVYERIHELKAWALKNGRSIF